MDSRKWSFKKLNFNKQNFQKLIFKNKFLENWIEESQVIPKIGWKSKSFKISKSVFLYFSLTILKMDLVHLNSSKVCSLWQICFLLTTQCRNWSFLVLSLDPILYFFLISLIIMKKSLNFELFCTKMQSIWLFKNQSEIVGFVQLLHSYLACYIVLFLP